MSNIPKIRFKGFEGEWEEAPFASIAHRVSTSGTSGILPGVEFEDIISGAGLLNKNLCDKNCKKIGKLFSCGDILFGKLRPYLRNILLADFDGVAIGDFWVLRPEGIEPKLLYELVNSAAFMHVANISSGSKMPRADWVYVSNALFAIPYDEDEQKKIASYFTAIDKQISAQAKHIEKLRQMKEASLQAMFPAEGETVPKVRFKGFDGEWKKVKFDDVFIYLKNNSLARAELSENGDVMNVHYGDVLIKYPACLDVLKEEMTFIKNNAIGNKLYKSCHLQTGDIIFADAAEDNTVGKCTEIENSTNMPVVSGLHTIPVRPIKGFAEKYLGYYLNSPSYHNQLLPHIQGTKISSISKRALSQTYIVSAESQSEQQKIASYFTSLDKQISVRTKRLEKLRQIKSACLDAMFV